MANKEMIEKTIAEWENDPKTKDAWQKVWEYVRALRIGGGTEEWVYTDDAWLLAAEFCNTVLGIDDSTEDPITPEWEALMDKCTQAIASLL